MGLLLRAATDSGGPGPALAAKGIAASGQNMCVVAEAIEQRGGELLVQNLAIVVLFGAQ